MEDINFAGYIALVVDDEPPFRRFFKTLLEKAMKFQVFEASNPVDAFRIMNENKINLIILDMEMPIMDGFTALKKIRENEEYLSIPIIVCSALRSRDLFASLARLRIADYIIKPSNSPTIMAKVHNAMNKYYNLGLDNHEIVPEEKVAASPQKTPQSSEVTNSETPTTTIIELSDRKES